MGPYRIWKLLTVWGGGMCRNVRDGLRPLIAVSRSAAIACSLDGAAHADRIREWRELLSRSEVRRLDGGRYAAQLPVELAEVATRLVVAEQRCCPFLSFQLTFTSSGVELTAHASEGAEALVAELFTSDAGESCPC